MTDIAELFCGCCQNTLPAISFGGKACICEGCTTLAKGDFFQHVNNAWLTDPTITIPDEYPRWGSFIKLVDDALKAQIKLLHELVGKTNGKDEETIAAIWGASLKRFEDWEAGRGDYADLFKELATLNEHLTTSLEEDDQGYLTGLTKYMARCAEIGISTPLVFGKEANLDDSENVVMDLSPSGTSLPSRDYYLDATFEQQRGQWKEHLTKLQAMVGADKLEEGFVERVIRMETKLSQISMKRDQSRQFDQYYTVTTLDDLIKTPNDLKYLKEKDANYSENVVAEGDPDKELLSSTDYKVGETDIALMAKFWEQLVDSLGLRNVQVDNYKKNYPEKTDATTAQHRMMVFDGDYFRRVVALLYRKENRRDVRAYLQYKILRSGASMCTKALDEEFFDFYSRKLGGQKEQKTHEKRTVGLINKWVGELMGKIYVSRHFSEDDKTTVRGMVMDVLEIMKVSLKKNDWLCQATKEKAQEKLAKFIVKLGYPDKWKNFELLGITAGDSLYVMQQKVNAFEHRTEFLEKINTVKDKTKWEMNPQDVNAYFHPLNNEIVFPAAIMQPPFYQRSLDVMDVDPAVASRDMPGLLTAVNFGGIGAVIAHEITHGYDDQGRKFDSDGNINDWWQEEDAKLFNAKCELIKEQAKTWTFEETPDEDAPAGTESKVHHMNGELTMGENLADLGGMSLACQAMQKRLGDSIQKDHYVAFFRSWANVWKSKETKAFIVQALNTDPHAPPSFRGNLVKNIDAFYEAFDVKIGDPMYVAPEKRVQMW